MIANEKNKYVSGDAPIAFSNKFHHKTESQKSFPTDKISLLALGILNEPYIWYKTFFFFSNVPHF